jgi:hypothetical protein
MGSVDFLNLEYLLLRVYRLFGDIEEAVATTTPDDVGRFILTTWEQFSIAGLTLAFVLFVAYIIVRIKLVVVEHRHHEQEHHAAASAHHGQEQGGNKRWERVVVLAASAHEGDWRRAIIEADGMLGEGLEARGYVGEGVGEQLRNTNPLQLTTLDLAWQAHKMRNQVAHSGEELQLTHRETLATIDQYRRVFEEMGII